jgi:hypothetical protein
MGDGTLNLTFTSKGSRVIASGSWQTDGPSWIHSLSLETEFRSLLWGWGLGPLYATLLVAAVPVLCKARWIILLSPLTMGSFDISNFEFSRGSAKEARTGP